MPIQFTCPHCQTTTMVADQFLGHSGPCGNCGQTVTVPAPHGFGPSPGFAPPVEDSAAMRMLIPVGRSGWAIAAGYFGLFSLMILPAPLALLFGILAVRDIRQNDKLHGMGRAIFGIVMGALGTAFLLFGLLGLAAGW